MIKVTDIAYGRIRSPDLDEQEEFLTDFGMVRAERTRTALYMRGTDPEHHIHVTELGESGFISLAFNVESEEDLDKASGIDGASPVEEMDEPGGGRRVRLTEPNGYTIEFVHGIETLTPIQIPRFALNMGAERLARKGELTRIDRGPSHVKRIGHAVMMTPDLENSVAWVRETLGLDLLGRRLCRRRRGQHHPLVQPGRPRPGVCRPPRVPLYPRDESRPQPHGLRGPGHR